MGLMFLKKGRLASTFKFPEKEVLADSLQRCLEDLERGEISASHNHFRKITELEYSQEEAQIVCWIAIHMGLALMDEKSLGAAVPWFEHAISVAGASGFSRCVPLLETLLNLCKAWYAAIDTRKRVAQTLINLSEEIQALEDELRTGVDRLHQALSSSQITMRSSSTTTQVSKFSRDDFQETLCVRMLGVFAVEKESGEPVPLCSNRKGQTIFKLLASKPGNRFHKEVLLEMLWPNEDSNVASGKLHIAVSRLRRALENAGLGSETIVFENDSYGLSEAVKINTDIVDFDHCFKTGWRHREQGSLDLANHKFERALELYRGKYLSGTIGEDWILPDQMRLEDQYLTLLTISARYRYAKGEYDEAADLCRRALVLDDLREDLHRILMRCQYQGGQRAQALCTFKELRGLLKRELGVEPMRATRQLAEQIRSEQDL